MSPRITSVLPAYLSDPRALESRSAATLVVQRALPRRVSNEHRFTSLALAQAVIEASRRECNQERPKRGLGALTRRMWATVDGTNEGVES